jgi:thymidylate synthase
MDKIKKFRKRPIAHEAMQFTRTTFDNIKKFTNNTASYGLLLELIAKTVNLKPRNLIGFLADVHIYENHISQLEEQLTRNPLELPKLELLDTFTDLFNWRCDEFKLTNYNHHDKIKMDIAV